MNSQSAAKIRFDKENYDSILTKWPKGAREKLKTLAAAEGISVNRYILEAVEARSGLKLTLDNALPWIKKENSEQEAPE